MLQGTVQSILGSLALHSSASAQGSTASTPSLFSLLLWQANKSDKNDASQEETLLRKCQTWRCPTKSFTAHPCHPHSVPRDAGNTSGSNFFQPHLTSDPPTRQGVCAHVCVYTLAQEGVRTFNCILDLTQYMWHQAMALLELTLYRAVEAKAQFSQFSPRPSRMSG